MQEAFGYTIVDSVKGLGYFDYEGMRNAIVNGYANKRPQIEASISEIGLLAGGSEGIVALAKLVEKQIADNS